MQTVCLKMENNLLKEIDSKIKSNRYSTRTEFIRDAIRDKLSQLEKDEAIRNLEKLKGSIKRKSKISYEKARELAFKEHTKRFDINLK